MIIIAPLCIPMCRKNSLINETCLSLLFFNNEKVHKIKLITIKATNTYILDGNRSFITTLNPAFDLVALIQIIAAPVNTTINEDN
jgi:hypothetical protein